MPLAMPPKPSHIFPLNSQTKSIFFPFTWRFKALGREFLQGKVMWDLHPGTGMRNNFVHLSSLLLLFLLSPAKRCNNNFPTWSRSCCKVAASPIKIPAAAGFWGRGCWRRGSPWDIAFPPLLPAQVIPHKPALCDGKHSGSGMCLQPKKTSLDSASFPCS